MGQFGGWVRLHYVYPYPKVESLLALMQEGLILPYLDMPLQHSSPKILARMKRPVHAENILDRLQRWRQAVPDLTVRSTFIVGFPGETDEDFNTLLQFLDAAQLDRVGCFTYSPIEGAAAHGLEGAVSEEVKEERKMRLMAHQEAISTKRLKRWVGRTVEVIVDAVEGETAMGRCKGDAPEIDGIVEIAGLTHEKPGDRVQVRIERSSSHDLSGRKVAR
jgi:ribosomal protein S12 methylthiotransferase